MGSTTWERRCVWAASVELLHGKLALDLLHWKDCMSSTAWKALHRELPLELPHGQLPLELPHGQLSLELPHGNDCMDIQAWLFLMIVCTAKGGAHHRSGIGIWPSSPQFCTQPHPHRRQPPRFSPQRL
eukprot:353017-Chlamydomonas_euryale.AAC.5